MAAVKPSFEAEDSGMGRGAEESSAAVKFTTVNGNKGAASPSQTTSFRPDPSALVIPHQHQALPGQAPPLERKQKPLFVDSEDNRPIFHEDPPFRSPGNQSTRAGKRKRSGEAFNTSPEFASPPPQREDTFQQPIKTRSPTRSLPPLMQLQEGEPQHALRDQVPSWRQQRLSPGQTEMQLEDAMRRDSHMLQTRHDQHDGSDSPQMEADMQSEQESEMQNDSLSGRKGPAQRRRFSQRTKTGCHTCRRRKKKCDEAKPQCTNCTRGGFPCEGYGPKHELNVKLPSKTVPLQAKSVEGHAFPAHRQSAPGAAAEHWLEAQRRFSYDARPQPFSDNIRYTPNNGPRTIAPPEHESPFPSDRFSRSNHPDKPRAPPSSSRFGMSAPSIMTETNGGSLSHSSGAGTTSLGSAFDTPRAILATRLAMNPPPGVYHSSGPSEKDNMLNGRDYRHFTDPELLSDRAWCRLAIERYNKASKPSFDIDMDGRMRLFRQILQPDRLLHQADSRNHPIGTIGSKILIEAPFKCEYGYNIHIADNVVIQAGCVMYDPCAITIGRGTIVGPNVKFYGLGPDTRLDARVRNGSDGKLRGGKIMIEEDCFIGGDVVIMPNVIIGRECVVEPGTVVSSNIQPGKVVAGNPMRIIRDVVPIPNQEEEYNRVEPSMLGSLWPAERSYNRDARMGM
ncbi:trimeric LpxA-like protein [Aureobasidium subglaciale]|nr:trimeric LpxA-like protein [Aureobasidium subglaciale]